MRAKAGGKCEYCLELKREFKGGPGIWLEAAHVIGRTNRATRWKLNNGVALCSGCHAGYDQHLPIEHEIRTYLITEERYQALRSIPKVKASEQEYAIEHAALMREALRLKLV